jgi:molybdopterin-guanine dinucleotide biosynthesis protein A
MSRMPAAALLLTGGASRRMGRAKAALIVPGDEPSGAGAGQSLACRTASLLIGVAAPVLEVGPGYTPLPAVIEEPPGGGPLAAVAAGHRTLQNLGWMGGALVVATDLPRLTTSLLAWLADHPTPGSVVPTAGGFPQPLCARYSAPDLALAAVLAAAGRRSMRDLLAHIDPLVVDVDEWEPAAGTPDALADVDTPADLARLPRWP